MTFKSDTNRMFADSDEQTVKQAEAQLFAKLAADQGVDLQQFSDEQVQQLWDYTFSKTAEEEESKEESKDEDEDKEENKEAAAAAEYQQKLAFANEVAQAEFLGQKMAESYVNHLAKLGHATSEDDDLEKDAGKVGDAFKKGVDKVKNFAKSSKEPSFGPKTRLRDPIGAGAEAGKKGFDFAKKHKKTIGIGAGAAAVGGGAGYAAGRSKESSVSNLDQLALEHSVKLAHEAGLDPEVAAEKVMAVATLGLGESDKLASTLEDQVHVRALEYLEAAGYTVNWPQ